MSPSPPLRYFLVAEDDEDDRVILQRAFAASGQSTEIRFVSDGQELLDYLASGETEAEEGPWPSLVLMDLNMPRLDGRAALRALKGEPRTRSIPVVILTTSQSDEDVRRTYAAGAAGYISKPSSFRGLVAAVQTLSHYWLETVRLPDREPS